MKIGIDIRTLMDTYYSGVSEYTLNLLEATFKIDRNDEYRLFYNSGRDVSDRIPKFNYDNVEVVSTRYPNKIFNNIMQKILHWPKIDQMLGVDLFFMPNIGFISLSPQSKKIITIHDLSYLRYPEFFSLKRRLWHILINVKKLLNKFDFIVAVSENTKRDIVELCQIPAEKVSVIYSGISEEYRLIEKGDFQFPKVEKKYHLPEKFILCLSTLEPRKNVCTIIKAFDQCMSESPGMKDYSLVIAGARGWKRGEIFKTWSESPSKSRIKFIGYVDQSDKVYLYNLACLFVCPSFYEGFGFPPLEAMACGRPVVTGYGASLPEAVGQAALMVNPYKTNEIAQAMTLILNNNLLSDNLIKNGLTAVKKFTWDKTAHSYLQLWQN